MIMRSPMVSPLYRPKTFKRMTSSILMLNVERKMVTNTSYVYALLFDELSLTS